MEAFCRRCRSFTKKDIRKLLYKKQSSKSLIFFIIDQLDLTLPE